MSMIGKKEPEWTADAYVKGDRKTLSSKDYQGKWHVLYFYPADFTFVCPTEIKGFQGLLREFEEEGIAVIGASTDSYYCHKAWFADRKTFAEEPTHPVLGDTNHSVARAFGVLKEETGVAYRATILVDNHGIIRAMNVNDTQVGRSPKEVLRTAQAFLAGGLCPAEWKKGEKLLGERS
jgi:peroxiredoxin (alkyl hydroperoxide reductase subunit C)